jgi:hypothetical protein
LAIAKSTTSLDSKTVTKSPVSAVGASGANTPLFPCLGEHAFREIEAFLCFRELTFKGLEPRSDVGRC